MPVNLWAFAAVVVPLVATPGASTAVVLRNSIAGGVRSGVATAVGLNAGSIAYGLLTAFGVSVALQRWPAVWAVLRVAGVAYLTWLGLRSLYGAAASSRATNTVVATGERADARPLIVHAREGFLTNALNPSIATFYLLVIPQFIPRSAPFVTAALLLTAVHVALAITWHLTWAAAGGTLAGTLGRSRPRRILEVLSGFALLMFAVMLSGLSLPPGLHLWR